MSLLSEGGLDWMSFKDSFQPKPLYDGMILWLSLSEDIWRNGLKEIWD